jgi:hypothetical protein
LYTARAIKSRGLYIFKDHFFVFKDVFSENFVLMYGLYSRAAYNGMRTVCDAPTEELCCDWFPICLGSNISKDAFY